MILELSATWSMDSRPLALNVPHAGSACGPVRMLRPSDAQDQAKAVGYLGEDVARDMSDGIGLDELAADRAHLRHHCNGVLPEPRRLDRHENVAGKCFECSVRGQRNDKYCRDLRGEKPLLLHDDGRTALCWLRTTW
jgi:hypothetical protein